MSKNIVFISHASEDKEIAQRLYNDLSDAGIKPWLDFASLLPGQDWNREIKKAIKESAVILTLISTKSMRRRGFTQHELREVLEVANQKKSSDLFVIPIRVDDCEIDDSLQPYQVLDLFPSYSDGFERLLSSLKSVINIKSKKLWERK